MKKKSILLLLFMIGVLGVTTKVNAGEEAYFSESLKTQAVNPVYQEEDTQTQSNKKILKSAKKSAVKNVEDSKSELTPEKQEEIMAQLDSYYSMNTTKLATGIRDNMVNRNGAFTVYAKLVLKEEINQTTFDAYVAELVKTAVSEELATNNSSTGDYLKWSWGQYEVSAAYATFEKDSNFIYYINIKFSLEYYTTKAQENTLNNSIKTYLYENMEGKNYTDFEKIAIIYEYICNRVSYDQVHLDDKSYTLKHTAYAAMQNKTAVCQGYAALYYKMLKEAGYKSVRMMTSEDHAWNIVKLNGTYYNLDSTWDAGQTEYVFFLRGTDYFDTLPSHTRTDDIDTDTFKAEYPLSKTDYDTERQYRSIHKCVINKIGSSNIYTGKSITPAITSVKYNNTALTKNGDYAVRYSHNVAIGTANVIVEGKGTYIGNATQTFKILPVKVTGVKASKNDTTKLRLSWSKVNGAEGYRVYRYNTKTKTYDYVKGSQTNKTYIDIKKLSAGNEYKYKVRAYKNTTQSGMLWGADSAVVTTGTKPSKVTIKNPSKGKKKLTAKWKKVSAGTGYMIEYSTSKKFTKNTTKTITISNRKTESKTIKNLKSKKKYYVRIRAYKTVGKTKYYGAYSNVKNVTTK